MSVKLQVCRIQVVLQPSLALVSSRSTDVLLPPSSRASFVHSPSESKYGSSLPKSTSSRWPEFLGGRSSTRGAGILATLTPLEHNNIFRPRKQWIWFQVNIIWNRLAAWVGLRLLRKYWSCDFRHPCVPPITSGRRAQHFLSSSLSGVTRSTTPRLSDCFHIVFFHSPPFS